MSRWLWALLGGVVLVAIAALFWTASNQTNVTRPVSPGPTAVAPAPVPPAPPAPAPVVQEPAPSPPPAPPAAQEAAAPPAPAPTAPPAPTPAPDAGQQAATPPAPPPSPRPLLLRRSPKRPCRRPRPDGRRRKSRAYMRPRASRSWSGHGPIPRRIATNFSSEAAAAGPTGSRWTSSLRPRLSSRRRRSFCLPPPARSRAHLKRKGRSR